ncbi:hypothetical protein GmRootA79_53490 (plasmid) [Acidovorax sp. A79]
MNTTPRSPEDSSARSLTPAFELHHPDGLRIACGLEETVLLDRHAALVVVPRASRAVVQESDWTWHRLVPWSDGGFMVGIELAFFRGALSECLLFHDDDSRYGRDWNEWSERKERRRAQALSDWLAARGWAAGRYGWGEVWVGYEPRTGLGGGWVRYAACA